MNRLLYEAICVGDSTGVSNALQNGADANHRVFIGGDAFRRSMLQVVCGNRRHEGGNMIPVNLDIIRALVSHNANLEYGQGEEWGTPLLAVLKSNFDTNAIRYLLQSGARIDATDSRGRTALHHCSTDGSIDNFRLLLEYGANIEAVTNDGNTPLHDACVIAADSLQMVQEMVNVQGANIFARNNDHNTPFDVVRKSVGDYFDLDDEDMANITSVMEFLLRHYKEILFQRNPRLFLHHLIQDQGSFIQGTSIPGTSIALPAGEVAIGQGMRFLKALVRRSPDAFKYRDSNGDMPIHLAIGHNVNAETIGFLLAQDTTTLQIPDRSGNLPMHIFCRSTLTKNPLVLLLMIKIGGAASMLSARNAQGLQPLHLLLQNEHQGAECLLLVRCMMDSYPACVKMRTNDGDLPVYLAAEFASLDVLFELLKGYPEATLPFF